LEHRSEKKRDYQASSKKKSSGGWKKVREVSSFVNMVTIKRIARERKAMDNHPNISLWKGYDLETHETNV
tara:strand:- start:461 stop:670 length:210 start_codon:yes stop_codon:yes gene_type:complete